jgi:hypothetical protein
MASSTHIADLRDGTPILAERQAEVVIRGSQPHVIRPYSSSGLSETTLVFDFGQTVLYLLLSRASNNLIIQH